MSPQLSLKILLSLLVVFAISFFIFYKTKQEFNVVTIDNLEHQVEMEKKMKEAEIILEGTDDKIVLQQKSDKLISDDLKKYDAIRPETVQAITDLANEEIRRKNGLPPNIKR